jgi:hypothetical protein
MFTDLFPERGAAEVAISNILTELGILSDAASEAAAFTMVSQSSSPTATKITYWAVVLPGNGRILSVEPRTGVGDHVRRVVKVLPQNMASQG